MKQHCSPLFSFYKQHCSPVLLSDAVTHFPPLYGLAGTATAFSARLRQSVTASLQSVCAWRFAGTNGGNSPSMMQGGTASEHFFKQMFAAAPLPHSSSSTLLMQHAPAELP